MVHSRRKKLWKYQAEKKDENHWKYLRNECINISRIKRDRIHSRDTQRSPKITERIEKMKWSHVEREARSSWHCTASIFWAKASERIYTLRCKSNRVNCLLFTILYCTQVKNWESTALIKIVEMELNVKFVWDWKSLQFKIEIYMNFIKITLLAVTRIKIKFEPIFGY